MCYKLQCGLLYVAKKDRDNVHDDGKDQQSVKSGNVYDNNGSNYNYNCDKSMPVVSSNECEYEGCTNVITDRYFGKIVNHLDTHCTLWTVANPSTISNKYQVETRHMVFGNYDMYRCRRYYIVNGVNMCRMNQIMYRRAQFDNKYCLVENNFVQVYVERVLNIDENKIDDDQFKFNQCNYNYPLVYRKYRDVDFELVARSPSSQDIVWKEKRLLDFDKLI